MKAAGSTLARYVDPDLPMMTGPRGAVVPVDLLRSASATFALTPRTVEVCSGVHCIMGIGLSSRTVIEAPLGLIIFDTGDDHEDGARALAEVRRISQAPIAAVIYSHNHYAHGTAPFLEDSPGAIVLGHPSVNRNLLGIASGFASGGAFPEAMPALAVRAGRQFGAWLPSQGPDVGIGAVIPPDRPKGTVLATETVTHGEKRTIAGLELQFFTADLSDSDDTVTVWLPSRRAALNNFFWPSLFNFYTLRGDVFRDPSSWRNGLRTIRDLAPEHLINTHALPVSGASSVREALDAYMDAISFLVDQTLRGINKGMGPDALKEGVRLPPHLKSFPNNSETYSEFFYFPMHLYHHIFGWFDGDFGSVHRMPRNEEALRIVAGFGGSEVVLARFEESMASGDLIWASRLAGWLVDSEPGALTHRLAKARALRALGHRAPGAIPRHFALTQALELEGTAHVPGGLLPSVTAVLAVEPARYVDFQRVRLAAERTHHVQQRLVLHIGDAKHALHIRRGVCDFVHDPVEAPGDLHLQLDHRAWAELYVGTLTLADALSTSRASTRDPDGVQRFFGYFDTPAESVATVPLSL